MIVLFTLITIPLVDAKILLGEKIDFGHSWGAFLCDDPDQDQ